MVKILIKCLQGLYVILDLTDLHRLLLLLAEKNDLNLYKENNLSKKYSELANLSFESEKIIIKDNDYYYSNSIARASKTMSNCRNEKINLKSTGTEG